MEAIKGVLTNSASGNVDLYGAFGETQTAIGMALGTTGTKVRDKVLDAVEASEEAMGAELVEGYVAICGKGFFRAFVEHASVKAAYDLAAASNAFVDDVRGGFNFGGVTWAAYRGKVGGVSMVEDDVAYLCPRADIYKTRFAPGNFIETANSIGLPAYAKAEIADFGRGITLLTESNPISFVSRPGAVIKLYQNAVPSV